MIFGREPAAIAAFVAAAIALGITFGLHLSVEQVGAIMTVVTLGLGILVRQSVYSAATTQEIANNATYLAPGTPVDIGNPPEGPPGDG